MHHQRIRQFSEFPPNASGQVSPWALVAFSRSVRRTPGFNLVAEKSNVPGKGQRVTRASPRLATGYGEKEARR